MFYIDGSVIAEPALPIGQSAYSEVLSAALIYLPTAGMNNPWRRSAAVRANPILMLAWNSTEHCKPLAPLEDSEVKFVIELQVGCAADNSCHDPYHRAVFP
jgi:hypothetical protein